MENYESKVCTACRADAPKATQSQIEDFLNDYPSWELQDINNVPQLMRSYSFKNYLQAVEFTNRIAELAEIRASSCNCIRVGKGTGELVDP